MQFVIIEGEEKKSTLTFLSLEAISQARVLQGGKITYLLFFITYFKGNLIINNLFQHFEALWSKILPPDLKPFVYFFFTHPLDYISTQHFKLNLNCQVQLENGKNQVQICRGKAQPSVVDLLALASFDSTQIGHSR